MTIADQRFAADSGPDAARRPAVRGLIGPGRVALGGLLAAALGGVFVELGALSGLSSGDVLRDVAASFDLPVLAGAVTMLSVTLLAVTAAIAGFTAALLRDGRGLPLALAALSLLLAADDHFLLHERILPKLTGVPEIVVLALYALAGLWVVARVVREMGWRLWGLWVALFYIVASVVADLEILGESSYATEDLLKLAGFAGWALFWSSYCATRLRRQMAG